MKNKTIFVYYDTNKFVITDKERKNEPSLPLDLVILFKNKGLTFSMIYDFLRKNGYKMPMVLVKNKYSFSYDVQR